MEQPIAKPPKNLFVVLRRDSLMDLKCKMQELSRYHQSYNKELCDFKNPSTLKHKHEIRNLRSNTRLCDKNILRGEKVLVPCTKQATEPKKKSNLYVILEEISPNKLEKKQKEISIKSIMLSNNPVSEFKENGDEIHPEKYVVTQKLPVYKLTTNRRSERSGDLYEFNEPDFENNVKNSKKAQGIKKRKNNGKTRKGIVRKPKRYNTYNATVQKIIEDVMNRVNKNKLNNKNLVPIQRDTENEGNLVNAIETRIKSAEKRAIEKGNVKNTIEVEKRLRGVNNVVLVQNSPENTLMKINRSIEIASSAKKRTLIEDKDNVINITHVKEILENITKKINNNELQFSTPVRGKIIEGKENSISKIRPRRNLQILIELTEKSTSENDNSVAIRKPLLDENEELNLNYTVQLQHSVPQEDDTNGEDLHEADVNHESDVEENEENQIFCEHDSEESHSIIPCCFYSPRKSSKRIHVISDVTLNNSYISFLDEHLEPNANSTVLFKKRDSPWRFNENLKRNPYYLILKNSGLPCLQQDMVIDLNFLKKTVHNFADTQKQTEEGSNQSVVEEESEYLCDSSSKENVPRLSLYNSDDFVVDQPKLLDTWLIHKPKRNILGPINQNADITNVPKRDIVKMQVLVNQTSPKSRVNKPNDNLKSSPSTSLSDSLNTDNGLKLFEDEDLKSNFNDNKKIYEGKTRKRRKVCFDNADKLHHEKHKKEMSKSEEAELEQWAAKFNLMCEDISKYELEIE